MSGDAGPATDLPLLELEQVLERACGMALAPGLRPTLAHAFARAARDLGQAADGFLRRVRAGDAAAVAALVEQAVVAETYFFRHPEQLAALARHGLEAAAPDRPLTIWSAGCASGEEPYTLAMMLLEAGRGRSGDRILATDVSARALVTARAGDYREWSLRRLGATQRERHFRPSGRGLTVDPAVRAPVDFARHNLIHDDPPGHGFDVVLCRNVLIYFTAETALSVLRRLVDALAPGGWLLLGPVEGPLAVGLPLERLDVAGASLWRRPGEGRGVRWSAPARRNPAPALSEPPSPTETSTPAETSPPVEPATGLPAFYAARDAARRGDVDVAERLAAELAARDLCPEAFLLLAMTAEARGDDAAALEALRRALYLEPGLAQGHAALVPLYRRLGRPDEAARARRNALDALRDLDDDADLRGVEPISAGALRRALGAAGATTTTTGIRR